MSQPIPRFIRRLMPNATEAAQQEATDNFQQYIKIVLRIYERIVRERSTDSPESRFHDRVVNTPET
jgi:hypothetical protein